MEPQCAIYVGDERTQWLVASSAITGTFWTGSLSAVKFDNKKPSINAGWTSTNAGITSVAKMNGGTKNIIIAGGMDGNIYTLPLSLGTDAETLSFGHQAPISAIAVSGKEFVSAGWDCRINQYSLNEHGTFTRQRTALAHHKAIYAARYLPNQTGLFATGGLDGDLKIWSSAEKMQKPVQSVGGHSPIFAIDASNNTIAVGLESGVGLYDARDLSKPFSHIASTHPVHTLQFATSSSPVLAVGTDGGRAFTIDTSSAKPVPSSDPSSFSCHFENQYSDFVRCVTWDGEGSLLVAHWTSSPRDEQLELFTPLKQ